MSETFESMYSWI